MPYLIFTLAFFIRLIGLNQSLWLDEAITANIATHFSISQVIHQFSPFDFHPPLHYLLLHFWSDLFGSSEISLRFPSIIFSLLSGLFILKSARLLKIRRPLWPAVFFLFNPLIVYYSQEARPYMMATFFLSAVFYFFLRLLDHPQTLSLLAFNFFSALSLLTFYGSAFFLVPIFLYFLISRRPLFLLVLPGTITALIILFPLLSSQLHYASDSLADISNWGNALGRTNLKNLLLIPAKFTVGRISFYPKKVYYLSAALATLATFTAAGKGFRYRPRLALSFILPLILAAAVSYFAPMFQYFRFIYLLIPLSLALGSRSSLVVKSAVLLIFTSFSCYYLFTPSQHREGWKQLAASIPGNTSVYLVSSFADPLNYYRPDVPVYDISFLPTASQSSVLVIPYGFVLHGLDADSLFDQWGFTQRQVSDFGQVTLETWSR